jgi:dephospho-CoA kinase
MKIIAFTGMPYSGKTEAVTIAQSLGIPVIRMGDIVWEEAQKQGLELTDKTVGMVATRMRRQYGNDVWARKTYEQLQKRHTSKTLVIDGIRTVEEMDFFKQQLGDDFVLIAIDARDEVRKQRALSRGRTDDVGSIPEFRERDNRELGWGLGMVIASADIVVTNDGTLEDFSRRIRDVFQQLV